jgi:hypothetical protein
MNRRNFGRAVGRLGTHGWATCRSCHGAVYVTNDKIICENCGWLSLPHKGGYARIDGVPRQRQIMARWLWHMRRPAGERQET